jgi:hypothetical protein
MDADTIIGWIIAGLVTAGSVLFAHYLMGKWNDRREDRLTVFEPIRREMNAIVEMADVAKYGHTIWTPSDDFKGIVARGVLHPKRLKDLHDDVDRLMALLAEHESAWKIYYNTRVGAMETAMRNTAVKIVGGGTTNLLDAASFSHSDDELMRALASMDITEFMPLLETKLKWHPLANIEWLQMSRPFEKVCEEILNLVKPQSDKFTASATALLNQAKRIRDALDLAMNRSSGYLQSKPPPVDLSKGV